MDIVHDPITAGMVKALLDAPAVTGLPLWVSGTSYSVGKQTVSPTDFCQYICISATSDTADPASNVAKWRRFGLSAIKSIQRGTLYVPNSTDTITQTISQVNPARSELRLLSSISRSGSSVAVATGRITLTDSTTITASTVNATAGAQFYSWELTEYF